MATNLRVACVQMDVQLGNPMANGQRVVRELEALAGQGVQLAVFPECALTGYGVSSMAEARQIALPEGHPALNAISTACQAHGIHAVVGFAQLQGDQVLNAAWMFCPDGAIHRYAKTHLPCLGLDRFAARGTDLPVFDTALGRIGILVCYDLRPPEAARVLALKGADVIVLPTNWPDGAQTSAEHVCIARAAENKAYVLTCNRAGQESGFTFIGRSKIIDPSGKVLQAAKSGEEVLVADLDLDLARQKRTVNIPGEYELDILGERQPELYGVIMQPYSG